jgi:small subunit ribosomal protein S21
VTAVAELVNPEARDDLRELRRALEPPPARVVFYPVASRRCNALVRLPIGDGLDPAALQAALRKFKRDMNRSGANFEIKRRQYYTKPGQAARIKSLKARRARQKAARKARAYEAQQEALGR